MKYDLAIIILLAVISESDFCSFFIKNEIGYILDLIIRIAFIVYVLIKMKKQNIGSLNFAKVNIKWLLVLPIFLICCSNLFVGLFEGKNPTGSYAFEIFTITKVILTALCEEIAFRAVLYKEMEKYNNPLKSLLLSSMIFGLMHLANISSLASIPTCLLQALYSFGTGLAAGFIYLYTDNFIFPVLFHMLFNFFNGEYIVSIYNIDYSLTFFIVNVGIAILIGLYAFILFRGGKYATKHMDI